MAIVLALAALIIVLGIVATVRFAVDRTRGSKASLVWLVLIIGLPIIGPVLYLLRSRSGIDAVAR